MQSSGTSGDPRVLRCPHCGAPLELQPYAPFTQCRYCGHSVKLAEPAPPPPPVFQQPAPYVTSRKPTARNGALTALLAGSALMVALVAVGAFVAAAQSSASTPAPKAAQAAPQTLPAAVPTPRAVPTPPAADVVKLYSLESLLGVNTSVSIDGSHALMHDLFPTVSAGTHGVDLSYEVPLSHPWFGEAQFIWKNEKAGQLINVGLRPPKGEQRFTNQREIGECLVKGLGKAEVRETDHLKGEFSYFWGKQFPRVWANLYSGYLWLVFETPKPVPPITLERVVRTLGACPKTSP